MSTTVQFWLAGFSMEPGSLEVVATTLILASMVALLVHVCGKLMNASSPFHATISKIQENFPGAITNQVLMENIRVSLEDYGFGERSLVATSICCDEVNRTLEKDLAGLYGQHFTMGGLSGVCFGGVTAFGAMAAHIPDHGSCLLVYGPHVGVNSKGKVGTVDRRGRCEGGSCCGSAIAAHSYVKGVMEGCQKPLCPPTEAYDAQQFFVGNMLLPYGKRLTTASDPMTELPYALYDAQTDLIQKIVRNGCSKVEGDGKIALLGGIQINTPAGLPDYFLPLRFDVLDNKGNIVEKLIQGPPRTAISRVIRAFPNALTNAELIETLTKKLRRFGYGRSLLGLGSSLLCTSLCCDEVNRPLEIDLQKAFGDHFNIGGLAGFAFGGATGFAAMMSHIPDGESCLVVYGPHVGIDSTGAIGTVDRRGKENGGSCCGSAIAAHNYVMTVHNGTASPAEAPTDPLDAQQFYVGSMLLPHAEQLANASDPMHELPYALFQAQDKLMKQIVSKMGERLSDKGKIALVGGIQINTPQGASDYFLPLRFEVLSKKGRVVNDLMEQ